MYYSKHSGIQEEMKWGNKQYSERKQAGKKNVKGKEKGGSHVLGRTSVEHTLRVKHAHRIVLWFMGTAKESRML